MCFIVFIIHSAMLYGRFLFLEQEYSGTKNHCKEWQFSFSILVKETKNSCNSYQLRIDLDFLVLHRWLAFVFWFHKLACTHVNLAGKKQGKHKVCQIKPALATTKVWGESEYYLDLENKDKKQYEKSTLSNCELLPNPNVSKSLLLICLYAWFCNLFSFVDRNTTPCDSLLIIKRENQ